MDLDEGMDDETAIRRGIAEIVIELSRPEVSEGRLSAARRRIAEAVEILKTGTMENATA